VLFVISNFEFESVICEKEKDMKNKKMELMPKQETKSLYHYFLTCNSATVQVKRQECS
jgi:hypothetical protein